MPLLRLLLAVTLIVLLPGVLRAHEDTLIQLKGNKLVGLPAEYEPAELDLTAFRLQVGKHAMKFSALLKSLFDEPHDVFLRASWYHRREILPPYLDLRIRPEGKDFSYSILFNLETLEVIELSVILNESASSTRQLPVKLSPQQREEIRKSIETLK